MNEFIKDRDELLKNIDKPDYMLEVIEYCQKYSVPIPQDTEIVLAGLHKARLGVTSECITKEMKEKSKIWLKKHNYKEGIN